jgi:3-oxoacyl-[acyl-carrier protein] reductase
MAGELDGQVVIVTGGGRSIGRAIALAMAAAGAAVTVSARSHDELAETVALIEAAGGQALAIAGDVSDPDVAAHAVESTERTFGSVTVLINNAAFAGTIGQTWTLDMEEWWRVQEVNVRGPLLWCNAVLPGMVNRQRGRIINVVSGAAVRAIPYTTAYSVSKAALLKLSELLALELQEHGIAVFGIYPGGVKTTMTETYFHTAEAERRLPGIDHGITPDAGRPAQLCVRLAGGGADALSGCYLTVESNLEEMVARAEDIRRDQLYTLRLNV